MSRWIDLRQIYRISCDGDDHAARPDKDIMYRIDIKHWFGFWSFVGFEYGLKNAKVRAWTEANPTPRHVALLGPLKGEPKP
jgi:hypothetical protein